MVLGPKSRRNASLFVKKKKFRRRRHQYDVLCISGFFTFFFRYTLTKFKKITYSFVLFLSCIPFFFFHRPSKSDFWFSSNAVVTKFKVEKRKHNQNPTNVKARTPSTTPSRVYGFSRKCDISKRISGRVSFWRETYLRDLYTNRLPRAFLYYYCLRLSRRFQNNHPGFSGQSEFFSFFLFFQARSPLKPCPTFYIYSVWNVTYK